MSRKQKNYKVVADKGTKMSKNINETKITNITAITTLPTTTTTIVKSSTK